MAQALLPLKDLVEAKSRLAGLLRPSERRALAQAMVEDVLSVLANHDGISRVTLVSDDPGAGMLARKYEAQCWSEQSLGCRGLNPLVQCASARLLDDGEDALLVLHGDLPLLTARDLSVVLEHQKSSQGLIIGCDRPGKGTNLLAFSAACAPRFCFGVDSCAAHLAVARAAGISVQVLHREGIGVDVDEAADLKYVMDQLHLFPHGHTARLLHKTVLGARINRALSTIDSQMNLSEDVNRGITS